MAIPEKTQACVSSLKNLRDLAAASQAQRTWAEDQLARLNLWADNLGIFAQGEFSINHRLAKNRQVTRLVEQLVEALSGNIAACKESPYHRDRIVLTDRSWCNCSRARAACRTAQPGWC